jgi:exonuclease VII small subunit
MSGDVVERRRASDAFETRMRALEHQVHAMQDKLGALDEIREILAEGRAAFRLTGRIVNGARRTLKTLAWLTLPGLLVVLLWTAVVNDGRPPAWVKEWMELFH